MWEIAKAFQCPKHETNQDSSLDTNMKPQYILFNSAGFLRVVSGKIDVDMVDFQ